MAASSQSSLRSSTYTESEKTASSSKISGDTIAKEEELTKDTASSPIDLECHIQLERISKMLVEALYKIKLTLCLPKLIQEYKMLCATLTLEQLDDVLFIFEQYKHPLSEFSPSLLNISAMEDIQAGDVSLKNRVNPELCHLLTIMFDHQAFGPKVENTIEKMKADYIRDQTIGYVASRLGLLPKPKTPVLEYLFTFEAFRDQMVKRMSTTAADELAEKFRIKKLEAANKELLRKIEETIMVLKKELEEFNSVMKLKADIIIKLEQDFKALNYTADARIKKQVLDSDRQMVLMSRAHTVKNEILTEEELEAREGYERLLFKNLTDEKTQRARRFKVETQLLTWLQKYDNEMTDKQMEFDDLIQKLEDETNRVEILEEELAEQDIQYIPLMKERDDEYNAEMTAKMNDFLLDHAARVLQNAYREAVANRKEKAKLRKQLAKIKLQQEKEERRAEMLKKREEAAAKKARKAAKRKK